MEKIANITLYNADCMEVMKTFADKETEYKSDIIILIFIQ